MPGTNPAADSFTIEFLRQIDQRLRSLETQQNSLWRDAEGNPRLQIGLLPNGDYGFATYSPANDGTYQEVRPLEAASAAGGVTTAAGGFALTDLGGPAVTATIGATGKALVLASCEALITGGSGADAAYCALMVDGSFAASIGSTSETVYNAVTDGTVLTGLSPGSHEFALWYGMLGSSGTPTATFQARSLVVWPL